MQLNCSRAMLKNSLVCHFLLGCLRVGSILFFAYIKDTQIIKIYFLAKECHKKDTEFIIYTSGRDET